MITGRTQPLMVLFGCAALLLTWRLFHIQVVENGFWEVEAARLVHSGRELPYRRGKILDAKGRVLARDKETNDLVLVYREFRRGHPLGQVAHARSLLAGYPIPLPETRDHLYEWAAELVAISPRVLAAFADGVGFTTPTLDVPPTDAPGDANRRRRAADVRFYVKRLLGLDLRQQRSLRSLERNREENRTYLELAALVRSQGALGPVSAEDLWGEVREHCRRSLDMLERLARLMDSTSRATDAPLRTDPLAFLLDEIEESRRWVEDATAAKLFAEAAGFAPGRLDPETLLDTLDLAWIARLLAWDGKRTSDWARRTRMSWRRSWVDELLISQLVWQLVIDPSFEPGPDDVLSRLATVFRSREAVAAALDRGETRDWRELGELDLVADLEELLKAGLADDPALRGSALPIQDPLLRDTSPPAGREWELLDAVWSRPPAEPVGERVGRWLEKRRRPEIDALIGFARELVEDWDQGYQRALRQALVTTIQAAGPEELSATGRLLVAEGHQDRAAERAEFFLKDYGTRPDPLLSGEPSYDVIYLLTRYVEDYPGFRVREAREREYRTFGPAETRPAEEIIGSVSRIGVREIVRQRRDDLRLRELKGQPRRSEDEERELERLVGRVLLPDEVKGVAGVEGFWNEELVGQNGYHESRGLQDVFGEGRDNRLLRAAEDGEEVQLTLDVDLQAAAQRTLAEPVAVPGDDRFDWRWHANPVGAIVLLDAEGDVLAAASEPNAVSVVAPDAPDQRTRRQERTLRQPTFQPPGSVFKPFLAAYALDRTELDPNETVFCGPLESRPGSGYEDVLCHRRYGHGVVALDEALVGSCNAYFAWLGERFTDEGIVSAAAEFGFGEETGIRTPPSWDTGLRRRGGLREDVAGLRSASFSGFERRLAGNGLGVVEATPMQLARATLGLATGDLVDLRLVKRIGERELDRGERRRVRLGRRAFRRVRAALMDVAGDPDGTAYKALSESQLGFEVAVKTGSADLTSRRDEEGRKIVRKHAWVAGWVPAEDPAAVFVVFVHDTSATSSHGAAYLARQFLLQPEILLWLADQDVDVSEVTAR